MSYMVSPIRRPVTAKLMTLVIVVALLGLFGHAILDALPTWPATPTQTLAHKQAPTRSSADRLATCAAHLTCVVALPAAVVQLVRQAIEIPRIALRFFQPAITPPTTPPK